MHEMLNDESLALVLRGYDLVPNGTLSTKIAVYTPEIVETILTQHPEIIDRWLQKLHREYINNKKICDFENDPTACFNLGIYEEFEKLGGRRNNKNNAACKESNTSQQKPNIFTCQVALFY